MKVFATVNYPIDDVFHVFIRAAKRDFQNFNEENPIGCKIEKRLGTDINKKTNCTIEITNYVKNELYQITTSNEMSKCTSLYTFKPEGDNKTLITLEESQGALSIFIVLMLYVQRLFERRQFKEKFKAIIESLEYEVKTYVENVERNIPKNDKIAK